MIGIFAVGDLPKWLKIKIFKADTSEKMILISCRQKKEANDVLVLYH